MDDVAIPIEELVDFPTRFVFKAVGHHTREFSRDCLREFRRLFGEERKIELRTRLSSQAAYISVTLTTAVESADELRAAYAALRGVEGVITVL
jgi:putative lipoic acid-binding regulatory protein